MLDENFVYTWQQRALLREMRTMLAICSIAMAFLVVYPQPRTWPGFWIYGVAVLYAALRTAAKPATLRVLPAWEDWMWLGGIWVACLIRFVQYPIFIPLAVVVIVIVAECSGRCLDKLFEAFMESIHRRLAECPYASKHFEIPPPIWSHLIAVHRIAFWCDMLDWPYKLDYSAADGIPHITYTDHHNEVHSV